MSPTPCLACPQRADLCVCACAAPFQLEMIMHTMHACDSTSGRTGRHLLVGGDFHCIAGQEDMGDPAGKPGQRTQRYWTGLRLAEAEHQL